MTLIDVGLSLEMDDKGKAQEYSTGTEGYQAPEIIDTKKDAQGKIVIIVILIRIQMSFQIN